MDLQQLQYFQKVARTKSMQQASKELFVSQSTLSQSIKRLEDSLGCPLFVHSAGKNLTLNEEGEIFLSKVDEAFSLLDEGISILQSRCQSKKDQVIVACSIFDYCTAPTIDYLRKSPQTNVSVRLEYIGSISNMLLSEEVDFAIMPCPLHDAQLICDELFVDEYYAIVGEDHPLYGNGQITLKDLSRQDFICNYSDADRNFLTMIFGYEVPSNNIILETNEPELLKYYISQGIGLTFMSSHIFLRHVNQGELKPENGLRISDYVPHAQTCLIRKKNRRLSATANAFYQYLRDYLLKEDKLVAEKLLL